MTAQTPAVWGQDSKLGSVWDPPPARPRAAGAEVSLSSAARLRATLLGLLIGVLALGAATAAALLIVATLLDTSIGSFG